MEIFSNFSGLSQMRDSTFMLVNAFTRKKIIRGQHSVIVFRSRGLDLRSQPGCRC
jgi:hypothetical protein